jgi:hypothetical protein
MTRLLHLHADPINMNLICDALYYPILYKAFTNIFITSIYVSHFFINFPKLLLSMPYFKNFYSAGDVMSSVQNALQYSLL